MVGRRGRWFGAEVSDPEVSKPELCSKVLPSLLLPRANILGHKGEVAEEFGVIMKALWSGLYKIISARDFKITIGKINDQFSGCEQQDSQELLLFLMDGLHEDLNKVGFWRSEDLYKVGFWRSEDL